MKKTGAFLFGALMGAVIGATLVLLYTPESGENLRRQLQDRVANIQNEINQAALAKRQELEAQLEELRKPRKANETIEI